jgi:hypothetical protein
LWSRSIYLVSCRVAINKQTNKNKQTFKVWQPHRNTNVVWFHALTKLVVDGSIGVIASFELPCTLDEKQKLHIVALSLHVLESVWASTNTHLYSNR